MVPLICCTPFGSKASIVITSLPRSRVEHLVLHFTLVMNLDFGSVSSRGRFPCMFASVAVPTGEVTVVSSE